MKLKKFTASSFKEAMDIVKKELGPDAVILSQRNIPSGRFGKNLIEVTAGIDENALPPPPPSSSYGYASTSHRTVGTPEVIEEMRKIRDEISFLKDTLRPIVPNIKLESKKKGHFNLLVRQGIDPQFAMMIVEKADTTLESLKETIANEIKIEPLSSIEDMGLMFVGPPGAGKTTSMSKIAYTLREQKRHVNIMTLDDTRIGSVASIKDIASRLKCSMRVVNNIADLPKIIYRDTAKGPILIDTSGHEFKETLSQLREIFPSGFPLKKCFLFDVSMNPEAVLKAWQSCKNDMIDTIGFTKLDMAVNFGSIFNISLLTGKRLVFVSTGPEVDKNLKTPTASYLASLIVGGA